jgi:hypothetical protein
MSNESTPEVKADVPLDKHGNIDMEALSKMISAAVVAGVNAAQPPRAIKFGEYLRRVNAGRSVLKVTAFQNDKLIDPGVLTNAEIDLLNQINRGGRYFDRQVEVIYSLNGNDRVVYFRYNNKSADQRFELRGQYRNFLHFLQQIVEWQAEENQKEEDQREAIAALTSPAARASRKGHFQKGVEKAAAE